MKISTVYIFSPLLQYIYYVLIVCCMLFGYCKIIHIENFNLLLESRPWYVFGRQISKFKTRSVHEYLPYLSINSTHPYPVYVATLMGIYIISFLHTPIILSASQYPFVKSGCPRISEPYPLDGLQPPSRSSPASHTDVI